MQNGDDDGASAPPIPPADETAATNDGTELRYPLTPEQAKEMMAYIRELERQRADYVRAALHKQRQLDTDAAMMVEAAAAEGAASSVDGHARSIAALHVMANDAESDEMCSLANDRRACAIHQLAVTPALSTRDLTRKLAVLVQEVVAGSEIPDATILMLAATALADAVVLDSGPIVLPPTEPAPELPEAEEEASETAEGAVP